MESSKPFLSVERKGNRRCLICSEDLKQFDKTSLILKDGLEAFTNQALIWSKINIPIEVKENRYTEVLAKINENSNKELIVHATCRTTFRTKLKKFQDKYGNIPTYSLEQTTDSNPSIATLDSPVKTRSSVSRIEALEKKCFICNKIRTIDSNDYKEGGLAKVTLGDTAEKIIERKNIFLQEKESRFFDAAKRLRILLSGSSYDIYAADIYYHQSCYIKFVIKPVQTPTEENLLNKRSEDVLDLFKYKIKTKIIRDKGAYFLHELLKDLKFLSTEEGLESPKIEHTVALKRFLIREFPNDIAFFPCSRYLLVHPIDINPCSYSIATLHGCGLRDFDLAKSFGKMIRRKIKERDEVENKWPLTPEELLSRIDSGPLQELYNAIYFSIYEKGSINQHGYAITSNNNATKLWSIASDWEGLISKQRTPKQIVMGMVLHRITGNKEAMNILHKTNHTISYNDIRMQNAAWSRMVSKDRLHFPYFRKGVTTHSTIDNNDGQQETVTGSGTTHDTNKTLFQVLSTVEKEKVPIIGDKTKPLVLFEAVNDFNAEPLPYDIGKRCGPNLFPGFKITSETDELEAALKRDIAWSLCGTLKDDDLPILGSWTVFNKCVSKETYEAVVQEYLPVSPFPPDYPVCKEYLDFLLDVIEDLEIPFMFVHSDELVYSKLCEILWKNKDIYSKIVLLMGGFHQLRVMQRLIYKRHYSKGYRDWCVDAKTIADGSADQAFEGRHYYRCMRIHKECFDALVQYRIENLTDNLNLIGEVLMRELRLLRHDATPERLNQVLKTLEFNKLVKDILSFENGTDGELTVNYLKDVSLLLSLVSAVRECNIEQHLQAEQKMIYLTFAYDHPNYARFNTYQNVYLNYLKQTENPAFQDLKLKGIGGSITGEKFSAIHGDLFTELFNKETKGTSGPFRSGFSTNIDAVNSWVSTIHIHTLLRKELHKCIHMKTGSAHKEVTPRGRRIHAEHVQNLKEKLRGYGIDPFSKDPPRALSTGKVIDATIVADIGRAFDLGLSQYKAFITDRLVNGTIDFYAPIRKNKLQTGIKKIKKSRKAEDVLKEDCQAFGTIISKALTLEEAFKYPITSLPLSIATVEGDLRQSDKASFRNFLIQTASASTTQVPKNASWLVDGMAAVQSLKSKETYGEWIEDLIRFITPPDVAECILFGMVNDTYNETSIKSNTRKKRGEEHLKTIIEGFEQHMPAGVKWNEFLRNGDNKNQLIKIILRFILSEEGKKLLRFPFIITSGDDIFRIDNGQQTEKKCNHEEADTRLILLAHQERNDVVVVAKDTDVLVLLVWAYTHYSKKQNWFFKYDSTKYADIGKICRHFGKEICEKLPPFHALTGSDTTSYFFRAGKVKTFKKFMSSPDNLTLLKDFGKKENICAKTIELAKDFIKSIVYSGRKNESYVDSRVRIYQNLKRKTSMAIPPDPDSVVNAIKRAHLQTFTWLSCCHQNIIALDPQKYGWEMKEQVLTPVWFSGNQFPPSISRRRKAKLKNGNEADGENSDPEVEPPKKKSRLKRTTVTQTKTKQPRKKSNKTNVIIDYESEDADEESVADVNEQLTSDAISESEWEVSDFLSSDDSCDEWLP